MDPRPSLDDLLPALLSRRALLGGAARAAGGLAVWPWLRPLARGQAGALSSEGQGSSLSFEEVRRGLRSDHAVAKGHRAQVLLRWGDPLLPGAPAFAPEAQTGAAQALQFGSANDYVAYLPWPRGSNNSRHGLLVVNHEHANPGLMFPPGTDAKQRAEVMLASHGLSVVEIEALDGDWKPVPDSPRTRRITGQSPIAIHGPAAGSPRLRTGADPSGRTCLGTLGNCAGGTTPWGTVLSCEENIPDYFAGQLEDLPEADRPGAAAMGLGGDVYGFKHAEERFDLRVEPREINRFGWVVEIDPYAPDRAPKKRTALGRFRHEGATTAIDPSGRVVVYLGDDTKGECIYRFVTSGKFDPSRPEANQDLLDDGVLSVARFSEAGFVDWLPLVFGQGPLTAEHGFQDQADVLIDARRAARLLGGTPMDRPEGIETDPISGLVYAVLTKNDSRGAKPDQPAGALPDRANPRANNVHGHILELSPPGATGRREHAAPRFEYDVFLLCGSPESGASFHPDTSADGWFSCPDNVAFDPQGRLWIATDGNDGPNEDVDGLFACDALPGAPGRGLTKRFFAAPRGSEVCGPFFTPDGTTLFLAVQHPAAERGSNYEQPSTRWPDFDPTLPPRSSVLAIRRDNNQPIG